MKISQLAPCALTAGIFATVPLASVAQVERGLAWDYPGDVGIENDPSVVFAEDFEEASIRDMSARWDDIKNREYLGFSSDVPPDSGGTQSLSAPGIDSGPGLFKLLLPGYETLFLRFYGKFNAACTDIHHYTWMGGHNPPTTYPWPRAGQKPAGDSHFSTGIEPFDDWQWHYYTYWKDMGCWGNATDQCHGNDFVQSGPKAAAARAKWFSWELMVKLNSPPDSSNGEQAFWIDGQKRGHIGPGFPELTLKVDSWIPDPNGNEFPGFQWRTTDDLKINYIWLESYTDRDPRCRAFFDHVVVATEYIGPMRPTKHNVTWQPLRQNAFTE